MKEKLLLRIAIAAMVWVLSPAQGWPQVPGDYFMAGYSPQRDNRQPFIRSLRPPLKTVRSIDLADIQKAEAMLVFGGKVLIGEGGQQAKYRLFEGDTMDPLWTFELEGPVEKLDFWPSFGSGIILLGDSSTSRISAVRAANGEILWSDDSVGILEGRHPIATGNRAFYHGSHKVVMADLVSGERVWELNLETARAPLSLKGNQLYVLESSGALSARALADGSEIWSAPNAGSDDSSILVADGMVYVSDAGSRTVSAFDVLTGGLNWRQPIFDEIGPSTQIALAEDYLIVLGTHDGGDSSLLAYDPSDGAFVGIAGEPGATACRLVFRDLTGPFPARFPVVAGRVVYFYASSLRSIRARDTLTGALLWTVRRSDVRAMSIAEDRLFVLFDSRLEVFAAAHELYFPHIAAGSGQASSLHLTNLAPRQNVGKVEFFGPLGEPLEVAIEGAEVSLFDFSLPPYGSIVIDASASELAAGWARVSSSEPLGGNLAFRYEEGGQVIAEAGVDAARLRSELHVPIVRQGSLSTAIAVANPTDRSEFVAACLFDSEGRNIAIADFRMPDLETLPAGGYAALFAHELFPEEITPGFVGSILIGTLFQPVVATALRTRNGLQSSSLPASDSSRAWTSPLLGSSEEASRRPKRTP